MGELLPQSVEVTEGMVLLPGFADPRQLKPELDTIFKQAPLRHMQTSRGYKMSVKTSNCGRLGWISDRKGYRYSEIDPVSGLTWPALPASFLELADQAAITAGFGRFAPDACLINQYIPGTQMGAHQDRDEADFNHPIVSVSIGIDARFFVVGAQRKGKSKAVDLSDGDVIVFGGPARKFYHGVRKLKESSHPLFGAVRWNLTFRRAG